MRVSANEEVMSSTSSCAAGFSRLDGKNYSAQRLTPRSSSSMEDVKKRFSRAATRLSRILKSLRSAKRVDRLESLLKRTVRAFVAPGAPVSDGQIPATARTSRGRVERHRTHRSACC